MTFISHNKDSPLRIAALNWGFCAAFQCGVGPLLNLRSFQAEHLGEVRTAGDKGIG